jgi:3-hydroxybutyryl-CoA dehydrogenase
MGPVVRLLKGLISSLRFVHLPLLEMLRGKEADMYAIPEIPDLKTGLFQRLGELLPAPTVLGSNTSSISLTRLAAAASNRGQDVESAARVVG